MEEREINLKHLIIAVFRKWKQILICALIGAIILGMYGYHKGISARKEINEEVLAQKEKELSRLQDYLINSIFLKNYSTQIHQRTLQIDIMLKKEDSNLIMKVFESYINAIQTKDFFESLAEKLEENSNYIYELVSVPGLNNNGDIYSLRHDIHDDVILSFLITVKGVDDTYTSKIVYLLEEYLEKQKNIINTSICSHDISIFNIQSITTNYTSPRPIIEENIEILRSEINMLQGGEKISYKKWILAGFFVGVFIIVGLNMLMYVFSDKLHESEEVESLLNIKTWSTNNVSYKKIKEIILATVLDNNYSSILVTGTVVSDNLKNIISEINKEKNIFVLFEDVINNPDAIKALSKVNAVKPRSFSLHAVRSRPIATVSVSPQYALPGYRT